MDNKIAKYKRVLNVNIYAIANESETFEGLIRRTPKGYIYKKS